MKMRFVIVSVIAFGLLGSAAAAPPAPSNVKGAVEASDLIVVGLSETRNDDGGALHELIKVDRVLKGRLAAGSGSVDLGETSFASDATRYGMFLLRREGSHYVPFNETDGILTAAPTQFLPPISDPNPLSAVVRELVSVFLLPQQLAADPNMALLPYGLIVITGTETDSDGKKVDTLGPPSPTARAEWVYWSAAMSLRTIPYEFEAGPLATVSARSKDGMGSIFAFATTLFKNDLSQVKSRQAYLFGDCLPSDLTAFYLADSVGGVGWSDDRISFVASLLRKSHCKAVRAKALEHLSGLNILPAKKLLPIGLNDPDPDIRQDAVQRICFNTGICHAPDAAELVKPENLPKLRHDFKLAPLPLRHHRLARLATEVAGQIRTVL